MIQKTILVAVSVVFFSACKPDYKVPWKKAGKPQVFTVNYPLAYFAERIGGILIDVHFPEINGDPAFWRPEARDVRAFQGADLILLNGATYAKWTTKVSLPESKIVNTSAGFQNRFIQVKKDGAHMHGKDGDHSHTGTAFTTWLDLKQAEQQAAAICDSLVKVLPSSEQAIKSNFAALRKDLRALDTELMEIAGKFGEIPLVGSHPVYQYLARGYDLKILSVHWDPDGMPDKDGWAELAVIRKEHPAKIMLWEAEPDRAIARKLIEQGVSSVVFDPCGNRPDEGDWLSVIQANISRLGRATPEK
jgi:zinc transport system substrate-binding protein